MKRSIYIASILLLITASIFLLGCAKAAVETAIGDFKKAVDADNPDSLRNALSPASDYYITQTEEYLVGTETSYFYGQIPVNYTGYNITTSGADADAYADATYAGTRVDGGVWFWFKREDTFLSFLFPDYKVYRYYDYGNFNVPVWRKIQDKLE